MSTSNNDKIKAGQELIRVVDTINREKNIPPEMVFTAIERAVRLAIGKHFGDEDDIVLTIDRQRGFIHAQKGEKIIDVHAGELGRIAAQAAKQQMIQLFREVESDTLFGDLERLKGQLLQVPGTVQRLEGGRPSSRSARPRRSCRAASRSPARRTTSARKSRRWSWK